MPPDLARPPDRRRSGRTRAWRVAIAGGLMLAAAIVAGTAPFPANGSLAQQPSPPEPIPPVTGSARSMLVVGDSVIEGIEAQGQLPALNAAFPGWNIVFDAKESRSTLAGAEVLASHDPSRFQVVVVELGTNDGGSPTIFGARAEKVMAELAAVPHVYWLTIREAGRYQQDFAQSNAVLREVAKAHPNVTVVDWNAFSAGQPEIFYASDPLHLSSTGAHDMVGFLAAAVNGTSPYLSPAPTTAPPPTTGPSRASAPPPSRQAEARSSTSWWLPVLMGVAAAAVLALAAWWVARRRRAKRRRERRARVEEQLASKT